MNAAQMRILHIGDIVGKPGRQMVQQAVPFLVRNRQIDLVIANGENAAGGSGITPEIFQELRSTGVDCVTLGDHIYRRREIIPVLERDKAIVRPANYPDEAPGRGWTVVNARNGQRVAIFSLLGRVFMRPVDCPLHAADRVLTEIPEDIAVRWLDYHAEATSDKQLMGRYLDGRVSAVLGTHTHVPTADTQILPGGTAFQCDLGMTGPLNGILGRRTAAVLEATLSFKPVYFDVARGNVHLQGAIVDVSCTDGKTLRIERIDLSSEEVARGV